MKFDRFEVVAVMIAAVLGCSSSASQQPDAAAYTCGPDFSVTADGSHVPDADAGAPLSCVVGQSYCDIELPHPNVAGRATAGCQDFAANDPCRTTPTCACMKAQYEHLVNCHCSETGGFATISCEGV
ncbi:MAG TPA: hypothetical protein VHO67_20990 [Polyangia bacterium]|nr:hypothetical protein [Polyangia bacterium]